MVMNRVQHPEVLKAPGTAIQFLKTCSSQFPQNIHRRVLLSSPHPDSIHPSSKVLMLGQLNVLHRTTRCRILLLLYPPPQPLHPHPVSLYHGALLGPEPDQLHPAPNFLLKKGCSVPGTRIPSMRASAKCQWGPWMMGTSEAGTRRCCRNIKRRYY